MVSKSRKQRQKKIAKQGEAPQPVAERKSVHLKKVRPHMRHKHKIRMGHQSADIYEGFEDKAGVSWTCPSCGAKGHVIGFCSKCSHTIETRPKKEKKSKKGQVAIKKRAANA